ncbi:hypothetical protein Z042_21200 [Chania multitudinisentens RB-25]|uniref:Lipopolysaccharide biosynthesis protein n=1 Tax=Chania multitudinisentens RB-25 TaxID=1441930 RepID=W0LGH9_9GAMM|nr:lipopolysaccharide biosynthesis protein [Chania multitudinisentens]AHG22948.1 hypothetical protein Z042_21200 [Chania multitudinisentens RB-25]
MSYLWVSIEKIGLVVIRLLLIVILSRYLTPSDLGLYSMVAFIVAISNIIIDSGLSGAIIQKKNINTDDYYDTTFSFNLAVAFILSSLIFLFAPYISRFYGYKELENIVRVLSVTIILKSIATTQIAIMTRQLQFKPQVFIFLFSAIIASILSVVLALQGFGYWSLVLPQLIESLIIAVLFFSLSSYKPRIGFSKDKFLELYSFGGRLMASSIIFSLYSNIVNILVGKNFGSSMSGYFFQAQRVNDLYTNTLTLIADKTLFPKLSKLENKGEFLLFTNFVIPKFCIIGFSVPTFIYINTDFFVETLFGKQWDHTIPLLKILTLSSFGIIIESYLRCLMKSQGQGKLILKLEVYKRIFGIITLCVSSLFGLEAIVWSILTLSIINSSVNTYFSANMLNVTIRSLAILPMYPMLFSALLIGLVKLIAVDDKVFLVLLSTIFYVTTIALYMYFSFKGEKK